MNKLVEQYNRELNNNLKKYERLRDMDLFVLDNSIRESTVGQLRGHTPEDKWRIYDEVKQCGFTDTIVASFSNDTRVDDVFLDELLMNEVDTSGMYAFSEITRNVTNGVPDTTKLPIGLQKLKRVGMRNVILEIDLGDGAYNFNKFPVKNMCNLLLKLVTWCHDNLHENSRVFVNFRDMPNAMSSDPSRVFQVVDFLSKLPPRLRLLGILYEDPRGGCTPEEVSTWSRFMRTIMDKHSWDGHLLVHVHEKYSLADATVLEALMNGSDGIWASVCHEGAQIGHAASIATLINMIRLGNTHVQRRYNCAYLREAAKNVTIITTGQAPPARQAIYGERALDFVLDLQKEEFDLADFFGEKAPVRISSVSSKEMIHKRLLDLFGQDEQFTLEMADKMKSKMSEDLRGHRKEEYMSKHGLAVLFCRSGGTLTNMMGHILAEDGRRTPRSMYLIREIRDMWESCASECDHSDCESLPYDVFYNNFMQPYFAYYRSVDTKKALKALDFDRDGEIHWEEFNVYLTWALREYPETGNVHDAIDIVFRKGLTPIIRDELLRSSKTEISSSDNKENREIQLQKNELNSSLSSRSRASNTEQTSRSSSRFSPRKTEPKLTLSRRSSPSKTEHNSSVSKRSSPRKPNSRTPFLPVIESQRKPMLTARPLARSLKVL